MESICGNQLDVILVGRDTQNELPLVSIQIQIISNFQIIHHVTGWKTEREIPCLATAPVE